MHETLEGEEWKNIIGYEELYQVSNFGRVKSLNYNKTKKEKIMKFGKTKNGYLQVQLWKDGKGKFILVHRLVAIAFIPNPNGYKEINHVSEVKTENHVDNLEWCDRKYNINYGTWKEKQSNIHSKKVLQFDLLGNFIREWKSTLECKENGYSSGRISDCCNGKRNKHKNYIWRYKE